MESGIPIVVNKYLPKDTILVIGKLCQYCKEEYKPLEKCPANFPYGHLQEFMIIKIEQPKGE